MARVKTPLLLQLEAVECGAACLGMVLEYYGKVVPLTELRQECGVSRDGVKASNLIKAARKYGLEAKGLKQDVNTAMTQTCPFVVFWNFNHFLVVEGFDTHGKRVFLNDPAHGHRVVSFSEFDESFTGVALTFKPGPKFEKGGHKPQLWTALRQRFQHTGLTVPFLVGLGLLLTIPGLIIPAFTQIYLDEVLGEAREDWLRPLMLVIALTVIFKLLVELVKFLCLRRLRIHLAVSSASRFFWHLLRLPLGFYAQRYSGEIALRQKLNDSVANTLSGKLADTALSVMMMGFYAVLMAYYHLSLTLVGIGFAALSFVALRALGHRRVDANIRLRQDFGKVAGDTIAALHAMETLKAGGQEAAFFSKWGGRYAKAVNSLQDLQIATQTLTVMPILFNALNTMVIYLLGGQAVIAGEMSVGTLIAFTALMSNFQEPIKDLVDLGSELQELDGDLKRLDDVLGAQADELSVDASGLQQSTDDRTLMTWPLQLRGHVAIRNLTFGYSPLDPPLFNDINIDIPPGKRVAFVGASGSGKSTLAQLICGLYKPWQGGVYFDNHPRAQIPRSVMSASFGLVTQEIFLFEGTVRDNLTLWDQTIPDKTLYRALSDAAILDVVLALPRGLDSLLLEGGANLSGGQRQRIEIARALVQNPTILLLDEATSALDGETERLIDERLRLRGCTCILIAHRLSTIRDCDEIIVLEHGKIIERGDHAQLWARDGLYAELLRAGGELTEEASP